jgi:hypothetical protein
MPKSSYTIASAEGAERYGVELGESVELDLDEGEELAVVAAGWLEPTTTKKPKEAKS